jgi:parallel beta-helix repeat protein
MNQQAQALLNRDAYRGDQIIALSEDLQQEIDARTQFISSLSDESSPATGSALVGRSAQVVGSISELRGLLAGSSSQHAFVTGYYAEGDGGGGPYYLDSADMASVDNGSTIIVATDGARWKLSYSGRVSVKQGGAKGDGVQDDQPFIQALLDVVKAVYAPAGNYKLGAPIDYKANGYSILGENMNNTVFTSTGTHSLIRNPDSATTTRLFCEVINVKLIATSIGANIVLDWTSCQLGKIDRVWILGQSTAGCDALRLAAVWTVTECTYNTVSNCLFGLNATGIRITDGANNNTIRENRFQPSFAGGVGILLTATAAGRVSSNSILNNGFEFPGQISNGVNVLQNCSNIRIQNNRFESLLNGIIIGATGNSKIAASPTDNYFSSNTTNINITAGSTAAVSVPFGHAATTTSASTLTVAGRPFNLTVTRDATGIYTFTFVTPPADTGYAITIGASTALARITAKSTASFTITTEDAAGVDTDASFLDVSVMANR